MMSNRAQELYALGQSLWYDNIQRRLLENGELSAMIQRGEIYGVTSNPAIFNNAITKTNDYDDDLIPLAQQGLPAHEIFENLAVVDIRSAADLFLPLYQETRGGDGYVSLEVNPQLAYDTHATAGEARRLWARVDRPNLMIKIPATREGLPAITASIAAGINVNVTLIFSQQRYSQVMDAYLAGLEKRLEAGEPLDQVASVASFFVSRIDTKIDALLEEIIRQGYNSAKDAGKLLGKAAVANAKLAYQLFKEVCDGKRFKKLMAKGANLQRPLWASTGTKNPAYSDVMYVDELIGSRTVNTVPPLTLAAFLEHGAVAATIESGIKEAGRALEDLESLGISMAKVTGELEAEGVAAFKDSFKALLAGIEKRRNPA